MLRRKIGAIYSEDHTKHTNGDKGQRSLMLQQVTHGYHWILVRQRNAHRGVVEK